MAFKDLDNNFEKIAQTPRKTDIKAEEERVAGDVEEKTKYETSFENPGLTGLLAAFQQKLKNRDPNKTDDGKFETINLTSANLGPSTPATSPQEVSEEQIDTLLKKKQTSVAENIEVEQTVSKHTRYEDVHPTTDKKASRDDITTTSPQTVNQEPNPQSAYGQTHQITDDEVHRQLIKHNQKKAEKRALDDGGKSDITESE